MAGHKCSCYLHVLYNIPGFRLIRRVSEIRGFRFRGWISARIGVRGGFGFSVQVSVLGAQRLHPIRTRPVAILIASRLTSPVVSLLLSACLLSPDALTWRRWTISLTLTPLPSPIAILLCPRLAAASALRPYLLHLACLASTGSFLRP